ncbi:hypothetical protein C0J52_10509 [Blattella germanica]|nr:hypothetical protein C0J52_10509 [Blattella germanica]
MARFWRSVACFRRRSIAGLRWRSIAGLRWRSITSFWWSIAGFRRWTITSLRRSIARLRWAIARFGRRAVDRRLSTYSCVLCGSATQADDHADFNQENLQQN